jgi:hypothetical protein
MSKTFLQFENVDIDIFAIKSIERSTTWNESEGRVNFSLIINNQNRIKIESFTPQYTFIYETEAFRNKKYEELKKKMTMNQECKFI